MIMLGPLEGTNSIGGVTVLFKNLLDYLKSKNLSFKVIDTNGKNYRNSLELFWNAFSFLFFRDFHSHASLHGTEKDFFYLGSLLVIRKLLGGGTYSMRKFAGNYIEFYENYPLLKKAWIDIVLKNSEVNFFETKVIATYFEKYNCNTRWFPNVRKASGFQVSKTSCFPFRIVFIAQLTKDKGLLEAIRAVESLNVAGKHFTLDIYGPLKEKELEIAIQNSSSSICYKGVISPDNVQETLSKYNLLLFPTYYPGEGYPGVIVEAFSVGLPVVASNWKFIPELFLDDIFLSEPKSLSSIMEKILLVQKNYLKSIEHSIRCFEGYDSELANECFLKCVVGGN